jgi:hypothetical protein
MPEFHIDNTARPPKDVWRDLSLLERGFVEAMFFTSTGPDDEVQDANVNELSDCSLAKIKAICAAFEATNGYKSYVSDDEYQGDDETTGRDLWYTSQGHGCGFWDGDYTAPHEDALAEAAKDVGEKYLYRGDDGLLYLG